MTTEKVSIEKALQVIANLQQNLEQVRKENSYLRSKDGGSKHPYHHSTTGRILRRAYDDAIAFMVIKASDLPVSRRYMLSLGYSERRYSWAMGLLRSARVVSARGHSWLVDDVATAEGKIKREYERLKGQPNALELLRLYMSKAFSYTYSR